MKNKHNIFLILVVFVLLGTGVGLGELLFKKDIHPDYARLLKENATLDSLFVKEKAKTDSLSIYIDSLKSSFSKDKSIIQDLKIKRDEDIRSIDTMGTNSLYKFFSTH